MKKSFTPEEKRALLGLSGVLAVRMLGFAIVLPVFATYARTLPGSTDLLAGLAFGAYGLSQALLQIPFGKMSDRYGRRVVVGGGYAIFIVGCVLAAMAPNIWVLTLGFFLQGCGAVASAIFAWVADATDPSRRGFAMAILGMSVGAAIVLGFSIASPLAAAFGYHFIFWMCAVLSVVALAIVAVMPEPMARRASPHAPADAVAPVLDTTALRTLNAGGFVMMFAMRAVFFIVPLALKDVYHYPLDQQYRIYLPQGILGAICMMVGARMSDKGHSRAIVSASFGLTAIAYLLLGHVDGIASTLVAYGCFFAGFSVLESLLPASVSKLAPATSRGETMGWYNTVQYLGAFFGAIVAGRMVGHPTVLFDLLLVLTLGCIVAVWWLKQLDARHAPHGSPKTVESPQPAIEAL